MPNPKVVPIQIRADQNVTELLDGVLKRAQEGKVASVTMLVEYKDETFDCYWTRPRNAFIQLAILDRMKDELHRKIDEGNGA